MADFCAVDAVSSVFSQENLEVCVLIFSLALLLIVGFLLSSLFARFQLPGLLGLILTGILLGPYALNLLSPDLLAISADIRKMALIIILVRAGLTLDLRNLKKNGRPAFLMTFLPATFEILAVLFLAPKLLGITFLEAAILGAVLASVSPAIVGQRMILLIENGYGKAKGIPQIILAGVSMDDVYVVVLFTAFMGIYTGSGFQAITLLSMPVSIALGLLGGLLVGLALISLFQYFHIRDTMKVLLILSACFLLASSEDSFAKYIPFSGLLAVVAVGATLFRQRPVLSKRLNGKFAKIWAGAEIFLFVLVGATVDITALGDVGFAAVLLIFGALLFRIIAVFLAISGTNLNAKERVFTAFAYTPKAAVQAAIGSIPLAAGVDAGGIILMVAVLAIILTAPIGATFIDRSYRKLLTKDAIT
jgi:solute carrier family 9B (sodium/hydrogen exchanger), member 1/2